MYRKFEIPLILFTSKFTWKLSLLVFTSDIKQIPQESMVDISSPVGLNSKLVIWFPTSKHNFDGKIFVEYCVADAIAFFG